MATTPGDDPMLVNNWTETAAAVRSRLHPTTGSSGLATNAWAEFDADFAALVNDLALAAGYSGPELDLRTRALCTVAALVAAGEPRYAGNWMSNAFNLGATPSEVASLLRQLFFYVGTPRTVAGFEALRAAVEGQTAR